ncbi:Malate dehydrogenase (oxaloacetate-decarboxylating) (NADP(+)) [Flavobacteria bacterium MS024-3C]|jgi:malate dehydrogenase (oxaloacetate-decarboxylating)(NADP+)|nr:Malate dehydrogenase (oxaloacetate-decarboxylating) (NADP(+)) [Flavobacteria bacterium MS024-3C]KRO80981.1 MAG: malic enzyme [Polaribacter sp. BACL8 MAG-120531-bin13]KRP03823.1 MAG: malic enzyme [Polaribacter sp. BACL8 MAG-120619-bin41]KRP14912.1 MAG: malic enzyme [Polaribacter sp. BACL8 MAG-120419-bin8]MBT4839386.1 NADP-dependent malic enzyme [Flavobacteriaceae bacterium]NQV63692.1 NADP-dependent malic enzyme [Cryomorphaceae bacterium]|tara:strand:- start:8693 stop:10990 length:2298 start_codon:yes stop_codon:yes gene_type:complete
MSKQKIRREALVYHAKPQPGKIKIVPTKPYATQRDLALAYSPGVAAPCLEIEKDPENVYKYTAKGNLVAVITNGTAVLGLGDIGPMASKPVMEGKCLLFKIFADIDSIDIELDTKDIETFIQTVKTIAPTFGGINLEDIKAPEAFEIERRLKEELDIPVMHDDQHGTAIISAAALLNALDLAEKSIDKVRIVISGAGAAAVSCTKLYKAFGAKAENIVMLDSKGVIRKDRPNLSSEKEEFATARKIDTLDEAMENADVFVGLSVADIVTPSMLTSMADNPIVFAMANPDPEIDYKLAMDTRKDIIMATGRSDHPNQVNNVLGFPFIFRGALDVRATKINEAMKMAAVKALADLAKEPVPEQVNIAYGETRLAFSREYIIPKPFDPRLISEIPPAIARAAMESGVAKEPIEDWDKYKEALMQRSGNDNKIVRLLHTRAKMNAKKIVFAEADHLDVLKAAQIVYDEGIAIPILLGNKAIIEELKAEIEFEADLDIIDPTDNATRAQRNAYATSYWEQRRRTGVTQYQAEIKMRERNYFSAMMVLMGDADGMISGYSRAYPTVVKPILEVIGRANNVKRVATTNIMITERGPMFLSDTSINIDPSAETIAEIAQMTANVAKTFGFESVTALLSYANFGSSSHPNANKVKQAVRILHTESPDLIADGEVQMDFALNKVLHQEKFPFSKLAGKKVNTLIFPNLESANITYKLMKELNGADSIGPIMMGLRKSVHILQLGASVDEIVNMAAVAVIDAQEREKRKRAKMAKS